MRIKKSKTKEFEIPLGINKIPIWNDPKLWVISDTINFPEWYPELVNEVKKEVEAYYENGLETTSEQEFQ